MPNKMIYLSDELYYLLIKETNCSKLIQELLNTYYNKQRTPEEVEKRRKQLLEEKRIELIKLKALEEITNGSI